MYYSQPLLHYRNRAISLASSRLTLRTPADLAPYRVAAFQNARGLFGREYAETMAEHPAYREHADQSLLGPLLYRGRVDVVIGDVDIFAAFDARALTGRCDVPALAVADILPPSPRHAGFARAEDRDAFDKALTELAARGEIERLRRRFKPRAPVRTRLSDCERAP
ncbi:ABC transporter substrate-binding protein [Crenobacter cavernae]|uniref:Solute-binding protein family 3/N-terminal domain-containing protein n=1 Tax=Crenobacter cavernae TaxID=2290923 RepID=A0A345Y2K6_9NEIS|nr:ABC transporter substrate-binding protein [Crenobacter cavernae]AXK38158.1 hypothetical protein DWG20_01210 [Crenobacter cavernae]